jgi:hypothetical protein
MSRIGLAVMFLLVIPLSSYYAKATTSALVISHTYSSDAASEPYSFTGVIDNNSILTGDHVVVNFTVESTPIGADVDEIRLEIWNQSLFLVEIVSDSDTLLFDTYNLCQNITVDFHLNVTLNLGLSYSYLFQNVTCNNFFAPEVLLLSPNGGEDWSSGRHNITWIASDRNANDELIFRIRFSLDGGTFWQVLRTGPMLYDSQNEWFYWDVDFDMLLGTTEGIFEIMAQDNDTAYAGGPHPLINGSQLPVIWPGYSQSDMSDATFIMSNPWKWIPHPPPITYVTISVSSPDDITLIKGQTEQTIYWFLEFDDAVRITVTRNGDLIQDLYRDFPSPYTVSVNLDELDLGIYEFIIHAEAVGPYTSGEIWDTVVVRVVQPTDVSEPFPSYTLEFLLIAGSSGIVTAMIGIAILRTILKRKHEEIAIIPRQYYG